MRKANSNAKKATRLAHTDGISLKEAWARVKSGKLTKRRSVKKSKKSRKSFGRRKRRLSLARNSLKLNRNKLRRRKSRKSKKSKKSRKFGMAAGPGYKGQTSFTENVSAPYFGSAEPYLNAPEFWYAKAGGNYQSPQMLMKN